MRLTPITCWPQPTLTELIMADMNITSGMPFAQIFFNMLGKKVITHPCQHSYVPLRKIYPLLSRLIPLDLWKPVYAFLILTHKTQTRPRMCVFKTCVFSKACFLYETLFIEIQISLTLLGESSADAEKRVLQPVSLRRFLP